MYQLRLETLSLSGFSTLFCVDCLQHILGLFKKKVFNKHEKLKSVFSCGEQKSAIYTHLGYSYGSFRALVIKKEEPGLTWVMAFSGGPHLTHISQHFRYRFRISPSCG